MGEIATRILLRFRFRIRADRGFSVTAQRVDDAQIEHAAEAPTLRVKTAESKATGRCAKAPASLLGGYK